MRFSHLWNLGKCWAVVLITAAFLIEFPALAIGEEDQSLLGSVQLRDGETINIRVREDLYSINYFILNVGGGEGPYRRLIQFEWLSPVERRKVEMAQEVLSALRNLRQAAAQFPLPDYQAKASAVNAGKKFAQKLALALSLGEKVRDLPVQISSGFGETRLRDAYRYLLLETIQKALQVPLVQATGPGLLTAIKAAMLDSAVRKAFWGELQRQLPAVSPDTFSGNEVDRTFRLSWLISIAAGTETLDPFARDCRKFLMRLR